MQALNITEQAIRNSNVIKQNIPTFLRSKQYEFHKNGNISTFLWCKLVATDLIGIGVLITFSMVFFKSFFKSSDDESSTGEDDSSTALNTLMFTQSVITMDVVLTTLKQVILPHTVQKDNQKAQIILDDFLSTFHLYNVELGGSTFATLNSVKNMIDCLAEEAPRLYQDIEKVKIAAPGVAEMSCQIRNVCKILVLAYAYKSIYAIYLSQQAYIIRAKAFFREKITYGTDANNFLMDIHAATGNARIKVSLTAKEDDISNFFDKALLLLSHIVTRPNTAEKIDITNLISDTFHDFINILPANSSINGAAIIIQIGDKEANLSDLLSDLLARNNIDITANSLPDKMLTYAELEKKVCVLAGQCSTFETENTARAVEVIRLRESDAARVAELTGRYETLQAAGTALTARIAELNEAGTARETEVGGLAERCSTLETANNQIASEVVGLRKANAALAGQVVELKGANTASKAQVGVLAGRCSTLEVANTRRAAQVSELRGRCDTLEAAGAELAAKVEELGCEKIRLKEEIGLLQGRCSIFQTEIHELAGRDNALARHDQIALGNTRSDANSPMAQTDVSMSSDSSYSPPYGSLTLALSPGSN